MTRGFEPMTTTTDIAATADLPLDLNLRLRSRRPARLDDATLRYATGLAVPISPVSSHGAKPSFSVIVVTHNNLPFTKLCMTSLIRNADVPYELIVVDNGSTDETGDYLRQLAAANAHVRVVLNPANRGF